MRLQHDLQPSQTDIWLTPPELVNALGEFDLDPCASIKRPWDTAKKHYTIQENGLAQPWDGRVWLNPPYSQKVLPHFLRKMAEHGNGIALLFARTNTKNWFEWVFPFAKGLMFLRRKIYFFYPDGTPSKWGATAPSVLIAYSEQDARALKNSGLSGFYISISSSSEASTRTPTPCPRAA